MPTKALLDTNASHNFLSLEKAQRLRVKTVNKDGSTKAINSIAKPIQGITRGIKATIRQWMGRLDLLVMPMDDFKVVFGMKFLNQVKVFLLPFANTMCIMDKDVTCMVLIERTVRLKTKVLSTI